MRHVLPAALLVGSPGTLLAQETVEQEGPQPENSRLETAAATRVFTVKEVLASNEDDQDVVLRGRIVRHVGGDDYMFTDGTGEIEIEIDDDDYPPDRIAMKTEIEIRGEVDLDRNEKATIEVDEIATAPARAR